MNEITCRRRGGKLLCILAIVLAAGLLLCGCGEKEMVALSPMVRINLGSSSASGVVYECTEEKIVIVTATHVLQGAAEKVEVIFCEQALTEGAEGRAQKEKQFSVEASQLILSENSETAFIVISMESMPEEIRENCQAAARDQQRFDGLTEGDALLLKGYSADGGALEIDGTLLYAWIYAEDFEQYVMLADGESFPGMSGGGVFDDAGNLAGIICGVNDAGETAAVPLSIILAEYARFFS